jgi:hypothetical protein
MHCIGRSDFLAAKGTASRKYNYKITPKLFCHILWQVNNGCCNVRIILVTGYANVDICSSKG